MAEVKIAEGDLDGLRDQVVVINSNRHPIMIRLARAPLTSLGGSPGVSLVTVKLLLKLEAHIVAGDLSPPPEPKRPRSPLSKQM
jgi:hypothetical protein